MSGKVVFEQVVVCIFVEDDELGKETFRFVRKLPKKVGTEAFVDFFWQPAIPPGCCAGPGRVAWVLVQSSARYSEKP